MKHGPKVGKWTKKSLAEYITVGGLGFTPVGTPEMVADEMESWIAEADVDGFNIAYAILPQTFEDVITLLIPELRRRGIFWDGYAVPGGTYRENLFEKPGQAEPLSEHPASGYAWNPPEAVDAAHGVNGVESSPPLDPMSMQLG